MWILKVRTPKSIFKSKKMPFCLSAVFRRVSLFLNRFHRSKKYVGAVVRQLQERDRSRRPGRSLGVWRAWCKPYIDRPVHTVRLITRTMILVGFGLVGPRHCVACARPATLPATCPVVAIDPCLEAVDPQLPHTFESGAIDSKPEKPGGIPHSNKMAFSWT